MLFIIKSYLLNYNILKLFLVRLYYLDFLEIILPLFSALPLSKKIFKVTFSWY